MTETPEVSSEQETTLTISEVRDVGLQAIQDVLEHLYSGRTEEEPSVAGSAAWAAFDLLIALTQAAAAGETEQE